MRKAFYTIIVSVYLLLSSGLVLQLHYCMDRLAEVGLFHNDHQDACGDCGMEMNAYNDCCQDRTDVIKLVQDQTHAPGPVALLKPILVSPAPDWQLIEQDPVNYSVLLGQPTPPDLLAVQRYRYRLLEVFRI